jgi:hypothetical protein
MRETCASGSVGGEGGNLLVYPANSPYGILGGVEVAPGCQERGKIM